MKFLAIIFALLIAHQCYSLPVEKSIKDDSSDSSDLSDSSDSEAIELKISEGHFSKEFIIDPSKVKKDEILIGDIKGMKSNGAKKTGFVNIDSSEDDSDLDDDDEMGNFETDSDESEMMIDESSSSEQDLVEDLKPVKKQDPKPVAKQDPKTAFRKALPAGERIPYVRVDNRDKSKQKVPFFKPKPEVAPKENIQRIKVVSESDSAEDDEKDSVKDEIIEDSKPAFRKARPAGERIPYVRVDNRDKPKQKVPFFKPKPEVAPKEPTPEEFEKEIEELKKEIQRMKVLGESDSAEDDEKDSEKDEFIGELIKKIISLRDEIRVEKGMPVEVSDEFEDESDDYDDSGESTSEEDDDEEAEAVKDENTSEEDGIKNIKLTQTFDGKDEPEEEASEKSSDDSELVKRIQSLKEEIKEERKLEDNTFPKSNEDSESDDEDDEYDEEILESEPVDEKLLAIFQGLEVNEDLKDIKHLKVDGDEEKPMLDIEKPENLESDEVKIGFIISNEVKNSEENRFIDLLNNNIAIIPRVVDMEVFPVNIPPFEFPKNDVVELVEVVEIPETGIPIKGDAKKNVPNDSIIGGVFSKVGGIFSTLKKFF